MFPFVIDESVHQFDTMKENQNQAPIIDRNFQKVVHIIVCPALTLYHFNPKVASMVAVLFVTLMGVS